MLSKIREFIKGVIRRMFNRDIYAKVTNTDDVAISNSMMTAIDNWKRMLQGKAKWVVDEEIESMGLERSIVKEFANITLSEAETRIDGNDELNEIYQKAIQTLNENLQLFLALGAGVIKPLGNGGDVEFIEADKIIPLDFDANGRLTQACFIQTKEVGDRLVYYRTEIHTLKDGKLNIQNKAFKGTKDILGDEIPLSWIEEWADLAEDVTYEVDTIDFGYYRRKPDPQVRHPERKTRLGIRFCRKGRVRRLDSSKENIRHQQQRLLIRSAKRQRQALRGHRHG